MLEHKQINKHAVQFYKDDDALCREVTPYLEKALSGGEAVVVIATPSHCRAFQKALSGVNPVVLSERLIMLDARETLARFLVNGEPDWELFKQVIGDVMDRASQKGRYKIQAYGEMVNLLWREGHVYQAIRLENLWNNLAGLYSFSLLCAYSFDELDKKTNGLGVREICDAHSHSMAIQPYETKTDRKILMAEDDDDDYDFISEIFSKHHPGIPLSRAKDGCEALRMLDESDISPALLLLDLNMPLKDGRQVLGEIRGQRRFDGMPVITLTTSSVKTDEKFVDCFKNAYFFTKPIGPSKYVDLVNSIVDRHYRLAI